MNIASGHLVIERGTKLIGQVRGAQRVEINGVAEGSVVSKVLVIGPQGQFSGDTTVEAAEVHGKLRGEITVRKLLSIGATGDVEGHVRYGQLAVQPGGNLIADVRNIPPELAGDFEIEVARGGRVAITPEDLHATDAEDGAEALTFTANNLLHGFVARADAPTAEVRSFTQADINSGNIIFVHDGAPTNLASFDVVVTDTGGASAGPPRPVTVRVHESAPAAVQSA